VFFSYCFWFVVVSWLLVLVPLLSGFLFPPFNTSCVLRVWVNKIIAVQKKKKKPGVKEIDQLIG
jgi:hypothetical protein